MQRYLGHLLSAIAVFSISVFGINWFADPYAIFGTPVFTGMNEAKPALATNSRIFKMAGYAHQEMNALILGTSRTDAGLNPKHEGFRHMRTFNLATGAQTNEETAIIFDFVSGRNALKSAVIGLDFFASNAFLRYTEDFSLENFAADRKWKLFFALDTLLASKKSLFRTGSPIIKPDDARTNYSKKFNKQTFLDSEKGYMWGGTYLPSPQCKYVFAADVFDEGKLHHNEPLEAVRSVLALAHQKGIGLFLFISPSHARQWEVLAAVGLWDQWEEWKRRLVRINAETAASASRQPFPLWDFSGYHSLSTEALPPSEQKNAEMFGYIESSHYKPVIGNLLLDRMFGLQIPERPVPDDFGVLLTENNIDSHLRAIRSARRQYRLTHPHDVAEIEALSRNTKREMKCHRNR
ncbi:MAG: hypothetical protein ACU841_10690 [Gammaproteobacteria bacterium]